ncbi:MAG TPA: hypothetical protein VFE62_15925 [Gemmataceae bacterium]|nr:hypothetical protein [Gemmataceae bacterium]
MPELLDARRRSDAAVDRAAPRRRHVASGSAARRMKTLVIGYGNPLRGDDALGHIAAEAVKTWQSPVVQAASPARKHPNRNHDSACDTGVQASRLHRGRLPDVEVICVHQLVPELCDHIKNAERILFIDAAILGNGEPFRCEHLRSVKSRCALGHHETASNVLALTHELYHHAPEAWLLSIAACSFEHGDPLTPSAQANLDAAFAWIQPFLTNR